MRFAVLFGGEAMLRRFSLSAVAMLVGLAQALGGKPAHAGGDGVPLPTGARFRFASLHLRHPGSIYNSALSPDGKLLATVSARSLMIWDLNSGRALRAFKTPQSPGYSTPGLIFSPDGTLVGYVHGSDSACVWNVKDGKQVLTLDGKLMNIVRGVFTADNSQFVIADQKGIHFWNLGTGTAQVGPARQVNVFSPDAKMYVRVDEKAVTALGNVQTGEEIRTLSAATAHDGIRNGVAFSPDGKWLALVNIDTAVELRDATTGELHASFPLPAKAVSTKDERYPHYRVGLTRDAKVLLLGAGAGTLYRWDIVTKKELPAWKIHQGEVANLHHSPDGSLITTGGDGLIRLWNLKTGEALVQPEGYSSPTHAALAPDGRLVLVGDALGRLDLWDGNTGKRLKTLREKGPAVRKLAFDATSEGFAVAQEDGVIVLWKVASGPTAKTLSLPKRKDERSVWVQGMRFSPDGRSLYVSRWYRPMRYELASNNVEMRGTSGEFGLSANGAVLATAYGDKLTLWDETTAKVRISTEIKGETDRLGYPIALAFSPDGQLLAAGLRDGHVVLLDATSGSELKRFFAVSARQRDFRFRERDSYQVTALGFSPDGRWLISGGTDTTIRLWEVASAKEIMRFDGHDSEVRDLAFRGNGRTAFSGSSDGQSYLWDLRPAALGKETPARLWDALAADDAGLANRAVWALSENGRAAAELLRTKIAPVQAPDPKKVRELIADLDSALFRTRDRAQQELAKYGERAAAALEESLKKPSSLELQRRLQKLLGDLKRDPTAGDLREMRALHALELSATPEAQSLLRHWAAGASRARLTMDAAAALSRLAR
jgi:WD40 repeat protein